MRLRVEYQPAGREDLYGYFIVPYLVKRDVLLALIPIRQIVVEHFLLDADYDVVVRRTRRIAVREGVVFVLPLLGGEIWRVHHD